MVKCGIYKITNTINKKIYIGSSVNILNRVRQHKYKLKAGIHCNNYLQASFNKYGKDSFLFEIIEECDFVDLVERENFHITTTEAMNKEFGFNQVMVNEFRKNIFTDSVKIKNSKINLNFNGNFIKFKSVNVETNEELEFDNLVEAANYLVKNGFTKATSTSVRQDISNHLRKVPRKPENYIWKRAPNKKGRLTYKHNWIIIK